MFCSEGRGPIQPRRLLSAPRRGDVGTYTRTCTQPGFIGSSVVFLSLSSRSQQSPQLLLMRTPVRSRHRFGSTGTASLGFPSTFPRLSPPRGAGTGISPRGPNPPILLPRTPAALLLV